MVDYRPLGDSARQEGSVGHITRSWYKYKRLLLIQKCENISKGSHHLKKKSICEKVSQTGVGGSSGFHTSIFFLISNVNAPKYKQKKNKLS